MARGGTRGAQSPLTELQSHDDAVQPGSVVVVHAHPGAQSAALELAAQAYRSGAAWVEIEYATAADNSYSSRAKADHHLRAAEQVADDHPWSDAERSRYGSSIVRNALGITAGDHLVIDALPQHAPVVESIVREAYLAGAQTVDVLYDDPRLYLERARHASSLERAPDRWKAERIAAAILDGAAYLSIQDNEHLGLAGEADRQRQREEQATRSFDIHNSLSAAQGENSVRWCVAQAPTQEWADRVYPELEAEQALHRLGRDLLAFAYCDTEDDKGAWAEHVQELSQRAAWLNEQGVSALIIESEAGELTVPLAQGATFSPCEWETAGGERFACNVPTSEVFTTPDAAGVSGRVATTRPAMLSGRRVERVELEFVEGRAKLISCDPPQMAPLVEAYLRFDEGANMMGEIGIVADSRVSRSGRIYHNDIIDENACTHMGLGNSYAITGEGNHSGLHYDLMIAGPGSGVRVWAQASGGQRKLLVDEDRWVAGDDGQ